MLPYTQGLVVLNTDEEGIAYAIKRMNEKSVCI